MQANLADGSNAHDRKVYGSARFFAETLVELGAKCGEHGPAAIADVRWGAITSWLMGMHRSGEGLSNPLPLALKAVFFVSRHDRACLGLPHHAGQVQVSPMDDLPTSARAEIMAAASETAGDWERAGCPRLDRERIRTTQLYVHACLRNAAERATDAHRLENGQGGTVESDTPFQATRVAFDLG